jgi:hypothetical protein
MSEALRTIIASALDWKEAHAGFDRAVAGLPEALRGRRPERYPHAPWELVEHVRLTQADLVAFLEDATYTAPNWPEGYWPDGPAPPTPESWDEAVAAVRSDRERLRTLALRPAIDLGAKIPWGDGQTYGRTILVAVDHTAYHVGQIVAVRRLLGAWPPGEAQP